MARILVIDDEAHCVRLLRARLEEGGHEVLEADSVAEGRALVCETPAPLDLVITNACLPDGSGLGVLSEARIIRSSTPVVVITSQGTIEGAVGAMRRGAAEYQTKPLDLEHMALLTRRLLDSEPTPAPSRDPLDELRHLEDDHQLIGQSTAMCGVRRLVRKVAATRTNVLLLGETGTGKERVARAIHHCSPARSQPLIRVNCACIPAALFESELFGHMKGSFTGAHEPRRGQFELAGKGNILLDEVSEIPIHLQAKLLRVMEERVFASVGGATEVAVEARIMAATNRDLRIMVKEGSFRDDLYYRLNVFPILVPPLRDRRDDIAPLAQHLLRQVSSRCGVAPQGIDSDAMNALLAYDWPGNVRELRNTLERAAVLAQNEPIRRCHLPSELGGRVPIVESELFQGKVDRYKRKLLVDALRSTGWRKKDAATRLGITQRALSHYVAKYDLDSFR